jgi:hypothetical protein
VVNEMNHPMATEELLPTWRNESIGNNMTTQKHQIGTPRFVQYLKNLGARPSSARPYKLRTAQ